MSLRDGSGGASLILPLSRLLQVKLEREEFEEELRELRERFSAAREEADQARSNALDPGELEALKKVGDKGAAWKAQPCPAPRRDDGQQEGSP